MIIVWVAGGLGNQFFQYAFSKAYSIKNNSDVLLDISFYKKKRIVNDLSVGGQHSNYVLKLFKTHVKLATEEQCRYVKSLTAMKDKNLPIIKTIFNTRENPKGYFIQNPKYSPSLFDYKGNVYFKGYFGSERFFSEYREELLKDFTLDISLDDKNIKMLEQIKSTNSVSLHIRRGDFVALNHVLPISYYLNSVKYILEKIKNPHFYIFSNDTEWVKNNLKIDAPNTIVDINPPNKGYYDLELMRNCQHNIRANSTFSWWGAWLNQNPDKIILTPINNTNVYPKNWTPIKID